MWSGHFRTADLGRAERGEEGGRERGKGEGAEGRRGSGRGRRKWEVVGRERGRRRGGEGDGVMVRRWGGGRGEGREGEGEGVRVMGGWDEGDEVGESSREFGRVGETSLAGQRRGLRSLTTMSHFSGWGVSLREVRIRRMGGHGVLKSLCSLLPFLCLFLHMITISHLTFWCFPLFVSHLHMFAVVSVHSVNFTLN